MEKLRDAMDKSLGVQTLEHRLSNLCPERPDFSTCTAIWTHCFNATGDVAKVTSLAHAAASEDPTEGPRVSCGENPGQTLQGLLLACSMASTFLLQCAPSLCSSHCSKLH